MDFDLSDELAELPASGRRLAQDKVRPRARETDDIARMATEIEAARLLTYRSAWLADQGKFTKEWVPYLSMAKYYATELAVRASDLAMQLLGAAGYIKDHLTELYYRDAKQLTIVEGTTQVQLGPIARDILDRDPWWA